MPCPDQLRLATRQELVAGLAHGLCVDCRRRAHPADDLLARITAERLAEALEARFVVFSRVPAPASIGQMTDVRMKDI